jgi:Cytochrome c oxidase subunit IV
MAAEERHGAREVPPPGEPVHLPGPSYLPVLVALGVTVTLVGIVIAWYLVVIGAVIALVTVFLWIKETREEIGELPLEH